VSEAIILRPAQPYQRETKNERFRRIATGRVQNALKALELVGKLASSKSEYSDDEAAKIISSLRDASEEVERKLLRKKEEKKAFSFD
jgi:hypothetical protein